MANERARDLAALCRELEGRGFPDRVGERLHLPIEKGGVISTVPLFIYRCPNTGYLVQGFSAEDVSVDTHTYEPVLCPVCKGYHSVNPATSAVLGASDQQAASRGGSRSH